VVVERKEIVMPGLVPGIHVFIPGQQSKTGWPGERAFTLVFDGLCPAMTRAKGLL